MTTVKQKEDNLDMIIQETQELLKDFNLEQPIKLLTDDGLVIEIYKDNIQIHINE